jgi:signal transduction histidine kinase
MLSLVESAAVALAEAPASHEPPMPKTEPVRILHFEASTRDARLIRNRLTADGLACDITRVDREETLRQALADGGFDLILADHAGPDLDGLSALALAQSAAPQVPFLLVSESLGEDLCIEALKLGGTDYVLKHRLARLGPAVRRALAEVNERVRRQEAERAVREVEDQLRHSQKLETVGELAGGIAHDFNNLLTVINGYCERLVATAGDDSALQGDLALLQKAGQRAAGLTRQLLRFSRRDALDPRTVDLNAIVSETARILGRLIGEQTRIVTDLSADLGAIEADRSQVEQILMNLAINARDAMPEGGLVTIGTGNVDVAAGETSPFDVPAGRYVMLSVRDTGHGMDADTMARIFEPFFTTKAAGQGTGLGLSTVHAIVSKSGGHIAVESAPGHGTTMRVFLPRVAAGPRRVAPPQPAPIDAAGHETILLVEDEDLVRELVRDFLQGGGYTVLEAQNAEQALEIAGGQRPDVDLLITDLVLPGINGVTLAEQLAPILPGMATLYISGYPGDALVRGDVFDPGPAFLAKPFTRPMLLGKVRELLDGRAADTAPAGGSICTASHAAAPRLQVRRLPAD